jgi:hypothetical protein
MCMITSISQQTELYRNIYVYDNESKEMVQDSKKVKKYNENKV